MTDYRDDPDLEPHEKEVTLSFSRGDSQYRIHAEIASAVRWLDNHPHFDEEYRRETDGALCALSGTLPVGTLKLSGTPRQSNSPASALGKLPEENNE